MLETSALYRQIMAGTHWFETRLTLGENGVLLTEDGSTLLFGDDAILVDTGAPDDGYNESILMSVSTNNQIFSQEPGVGATCAGEIDVDMVKPLADIPIRARMGLYVRACSADAVSEWIPQGVFYVDQRSETKASSWSRLTLHGYDAMLLTEADYPDGGLTWPATDAAVVQEIADYLGLQVDSRVWEAITAGYEIQFPSGYSCREVLGYIGGMYAGNWCMGLDGQLLLVTLNATPAETRLLIDEAGDEITFGGDAILV